MQPAIEHLVACKQDATVNAGLLDAFLLGARRMERIGLRTLDARKAAEAYTEAWKTTDRATRLMRLAEVGQLVDDNRRAHAELGGEFARIWLAESKPYALDWTLARYEHLDRWYADLAARVTDARKKAEAGEALPAPEQLGLALPATFSRRTRPHKILPFPRIMQSDLGWVAPRRVAELETDRD